MPITEAAYQVLYGGRDTRAVIKELMTRARSTSWEELAGSKKVFEKNREKLKKTTCIFSQDVVI